MMSDLDRRILDFERGWWLHPGFKDQNISHILGLDPRAYYRRLRELLESEAAVSYDPLTVRRLRRMIKEAG
jgi:Protein of unknown function (DUF3263)